VSVFLEPQSSGSSSLESDSVKCCWSSSAIRVWLGRICIGCPLSRPGRCKASRPLNFFVQAVDGLRS
jgi:hypothetical protein